VNDLPSIDAGTLERVLPMEAAIDALQAAFGADRLPSSPPRTHVGTTGGDLLLMPAHGPQGIGVKLVTLTPANPERGLLFVQAVYLLFDERTQAPRAIVDGTALTALRTAAVSGLATRFLANPDAANLVLFGAGTQAHAHVDAMRAVRPVSRVTVVSRGRERAQTLVEFARRAGLDADVGAPEAVAEADLVCTCTTSTEPVLEGRLLRPGAHVNAVGAYTPAMRELDDEAVRRARVVVETREVAMAEAGDLLIPMAEGIVGSEHVVADLAELVRGAPVRRGRDDVTVFKSVGAAFEDLVVAAAAAERLGA
jgi:ornithine cyclodeaminase/alanine dehydrogenase-like protein (mu-crystallin family)